MKLADYTKIAMATALIAVSVLIIPPIALPFSQVPLTLQTMMIVLTAYLLKPNQTGLAVLMYLLIGAIGLPVFAYGQGGIDRLFEPTGGFLWLFPILSYLISKQLKKDRHIYNLSMTIFLMIVVLYSLSTIWLSFSLKLSYLEGMYIMLPFIPIDILKILVAYYIYLRIPAHQFNI